MHQDPEKLQDVLVPTEKFKGFSEKVLRLIVGADNVIINVHQNILCASSQFLKNATKPEWTVLRDDPDSVRLEDDDLDAVKLHVHWLYAQDLPVRDESSQTTYETLVKAYVFGEKMMDIKYKNAVIGSLIAATKHFKHFPNSVAMDLIYQGTPVGSPARRLVVDFCADVAHTNDESWTNDFQGYTRDLLVDVLKRIVEFRAHSPKRPWNIDDSGYFEKEDGGGEGSRVAAELVAEKHVYF